LLVGEFFRVGGSDGHSPGERGGVGDTERSSALKICLDKQRQIRHLLQLVQKQRGFVNISGEQDDAANVIPADRVRKFLKLNALAIDKSPRDPDVDELRDLIPERELSHRFRYPWWVGI